VAWGVSAGSLVCGDDAACEEAAEGVAELDCAEGDAGAGGAGAVGFCANAAKGKHPAKSKTEHAINRDRRTSIRTNPFGPHMSFGNRVTLHSCEAIITLTAFNHGQWQLGYPYTIENFDMALQKNLAITESKYFQFRLEAFNVFNHAQFYGPAAVNGNITSANFGQVVSAAPPRQLQIAAKFFF
jgi:hypothetical protein